MLEGFENLRHFVYTQRQDSLFLAVFEKIIPELFLKQVADIICFLNISKGLVKWRMPKYKLSRWDHDPENIT